MSPLAIPDCSKLLNTNVYSFPTVLLFHVTSLLVNVFAIFVFAVVSPPTLTVSPFIAFILAVVTSVNVLLLKYLSVVVNTTVTVLAVSFFVALTSLMSGVILSHIPTVYSSFMLWFPYPSTTISLLFVLAVLLPASLPSISILTFPLHSVNFFVVL